MSFYLATRMQELCNNFIIEYKPKWDERSRHEREGFGIGKLYALSPKGINEERGNNSVLIKDTCTLNCYCRNSRCFKALMI